MGKIKMMSQRDSTGDTKPEIKILKGGSGGIEVTFPYNPVFVEKVKTIEGRRWHPEGKYWSFPNSNDVLEKLLAAFAKERVYIDPTLRVSIYPKAEIIASTEKELKLRGLSQKTRKAYLHHVDRYMHHFRKDPTELGESHIREYMLYLIDNEKMSRSYHDQAVSAIKFLYDRVLNIPKTVGNLPRPRKERRLPTVLSQKEVEQVLQVIKNLKTQGNNDAALFCWTQGKRNSEIADRGY